MRHAAVYEEERLAETGAELNMGMGTLMGFFFGLALVCGVFFGFGYMLGHRSPGPYVSSEPLYGASKPTAVPAAPKPSALVAAPPAETSEVIVPSPTQTDSTPASTRLQESVDQPPPPLKIASQAVEQTKLPA